MQYNNTLDIINVDSKYIDYLRSFPELSGVMEHKADVSATGGRKYVGVILSVDANKNIIFLQSQISKDILLNEINSYILSELI